VERIRRFGFANAVSEDEAKELYGTFAVPASDTKNPERVRC
jgi:hypothetical protein